MPDFGEQVKRWVEEKSPLADAAFRTAVQDMTRDMETPRAKGGPMPVRYGFLRGSGTSEGEPLALALLRWYPMRGDKFTYGWTMHYAPYMNARFAFRDGPMQRWPEYVKKAAERLR